jgi:hypothetical protein
MLNLLKILETVVLKRVTLETKIYIEYKSEKLTSKQKLISNTFEKYFEDMEHNLNANLLDENIAKRRFTNRLSKLEQEEIKKIFDLHDLDEVVLNCDKPYFLNLLYLLDSLNNIKYIIDFLHNPKKGLKIANHNL